jgi:hypothetical protein
MKESDYPGVGGDLHLDKAFTNIKPSDKVIIGAVFHGFDSDVDLSKITFVAPTKTSGPLGNTVTLTNPDLIKGPKDAAVKAVTYSVQSLETAGGADGKVRAYAPATYPSHNFVIAYELPTYNANPATTQLKLNDASGTKIVYNATLRAFDIDQDHAPLVDCGNAAFAFTADGTTGSSCIENSFLAAGVFPGSGQASPGSLVGAYYTDESPIQSQDTFVNNTPYGIDFEFTDALGANHHLKPVGVAPADPWGGYTLTTLSKNDPQLGGHGDTYNTKISWQMPSDPTVLSSGKFTVFLKAYDTDQNKGGAIGHDCGQSSWTFNAQGFTGPGNPGNINLVE